MQVCTLEPEHWVVPAREQPFWQAFTQAPLLHICVAVQVLALFHCRQPLEPVSQLCTVLPAQRSEPELLHSLVQLELFWQAPFEQVWLLPQAIGELHSRQPLEPMSQDSTESPTQRTAPLEGHWFWQVGPPSGVTHSPPWQICDEPQATGELQSRQPSDCTSHDSTAAPTQRKAPLCMQPSWQVLPPPEPPPEPPEPPPPPPFPPPPHAARQQREITSAHVFIRIAAFSIGLPAHAKR